jgi:hypothetical protein
MGHDAGELGAAAAGRDTDQILEAATGLLDDRCRQIIEAELEDEIGGVPEAGAFRVRLGSVHGVDQAMNFFSFR